MSKPVQDRQDALDTSYESIQSVRNRLTEGLTYFGFVAIFAVSLSLTRIFEHGWLPIYGFHIGITVFFFLGMLFKKYLSYSAKVCFLLGIFLVCAIAGLINFGLVGGGIPLLFTFALLTALAFGTRAGLIAVFIGVH